MLKYILGIPVFGLLYLTVYFVFVAVVFFLGDTGASPSGPLGIVVQISFLVLSFPLGYLKYLNHPFVNLLKEPITHNDVIDWVDLLNAIVWGAIITWTIEFLRRRRRPRVS